MNIGFPPIVPKMASFQTSAEQVGGMEWFLAGIKNDHQGFLQWPISMQQLKDHHNMLRTYIGTATCAAALWVSIPATPDSAESIKARTRDGLKSKEIVVHEFLQKLLA